MCEKCILKAAKIPTVGLQIFNFMLDGYLNSRCEDTILWTASIMSEDILKAVGAEVDAMVLNDLVKEMI